MPELVILEVLIARHQSSERLRLMAEVSVPAAIPIAACAFRRLLLSRSLERVRVMPQATNSPI
jgi:hypothetical protein